MASGEAILQTEPSAGQSVFITEENGTASTVAETSEDVPLITAETSEDVPLITADVSEDVPLITAKRFENKFETQEGVFSTIRSLPSTSTASLIVELSDATLHNQDREDQHEPPRTGGMVRPLIEVVTSDELKETASAMERPFKLNSDDGQSDSFLIMPTDTPTLPMSDADDRWATNVVSSKECTLPMSDADDRWATNVVSSKECEVRGHSKLLIEELEDDVHMSSEFTNEEKSLIEEAPARYDSAEEATAHYDRGIAQAEEALQRIQSKPANELSREDKVWQLAAQGGSTLEDERVELDRDTKERLKIRLQEAGMMDKVTLHF